MSGVQADAEAAGIQRADLAIRQSPRLGLAHHRRQGGAEKERSAVCADRTGFWRRARHACWRCGASSPPTAIRWCNRTICARYFPSLAALAWNEPRRRAYWETELINALKIVDQAAGAARKRCGAPGPARWGIPSGCRRSGSMSAWITTGMEGCHRSASPTTRWVPARATWSTAANITAASTGAMKCARPAAASSGSRSYAAWSSAGVTRADGQPFAQPNASAQMWVPVQGGPAFLLGREFLRGEELQSRR